MIERNFSSAHQLRGYKGKCENLHGHNYKIEIYAELGKGDCDLLYLFLTHNSERAVRIPSSRRHSLACFTVS